MVEWFDGLTTKPRRKRTRLESSCCELLANGCNLDRKNPNSAVDFEHLLPEQLADDILKKEQRIAEIMIEIKRTLVEPLG